MANTTIVIPVYNQYELFRQCIESIQHHIWGEAKQIIIVDDYSNPDSRLREYEDFLDFHLPCRANDIKVIQSDEYRLSAHAMEHHVTVAKRKGNKELSKTKKGPRNRGHGFALQTGINAAKTEYVMCLDADCVILKNAKGMIAEVEQLFKTHNNLVAIGQLAGLMTDENIIIKEAFRYKMGTRPVGFGGCPGSPAFFLKKQVSIEIKDDRLNLPPIATKPCHRGWVLSAYIQNVFEKGLSVMNYPVFSQKKVFHVGGGILTAARFYGEAGKEQTKWGMLKDGNQYGGRRGPNLIADWYQGRYILNMETRAYMKYLEDKYSAKFCLNQEPLDESLLYIAEKEIRPERI